MAALELTYCRQSRATEASIDGKETIATTILDYLDVEKVLAPSLRPRAVRCPALCVSYRDTYTPVQLASMRMATGSMVTSSSPKHSYTIPAPSILL